MGLDIKLSRSKHTHAEGTPLIKDLDGDPIDRGFNYASVVGMLLYLSEHSCPDIVYAVNCCDQHMFSPRKRHDEAIQSIGHYLKATRDNKLILNPSKELRVDCYWDVDFAGLYGYKNPADPTCAKSQTAFIITVANCPVVWISKLQKYTALSILKSETTALAHSCRERFPIVNLVMI